MIPFLFRRVLQAAALLLLISLLTFTFLQLAPGNFTDAMQLDARISTSTASAWRSRYGLDQPLALRYWNWLRSIFRGEFGVSFAYGIPVGALLWPRIKNTLLLTTLAGLVSWLAAILIGGAAGASRFRMFDSFIRGSTSLLNSIPDLLIALLLLMFAVRTGTFPVGGLAGATPYTAAAHTADVAAHLVLPVLALVFASIPVLLRHVQAAVRESISSPHIQAARAHGIPSRRLWTAYILPAAANPLISLFGYSIGGLLSSSLLIEVIMGWPGIGPLLLEAIFSRDVYVVVSATMISACLFLAGNLMADLMLYAIDPRIRRKK